MRRLGVGFVFLVMSTVACDRRGGLSGRFAEAVVVVPAARPGEAESLTREARVPIAGAPMGESSSGVVTLRNIGDAPLELERLRLTAGSPTFTIEVPETTQLQPQEETSLAVTFSPPQDADPTRPTVEHVATFELETRGGRAGETLVQMDLVALAEARDCYVPAEIDFGEVPLMQAVEFPLSLANATAAPTNASLSAITGPDPAFFSVDVTSPVPVDPGARTTARIRFSPQAEVAYRAEVRVRRRESCPEAVVQLTGRGSNASLSWSPSMLDLGRIPLGETATRSVLLVNRTGVDLPVSLSATGEGFSTPAPASVLPARSTLTVDVQCRPTRLGSTMGQLTMDIGTTPLLPARVPLRCGGGGPRLRVSPNPLSFGIVPLLNQSNSAVPLAQSQQPVITRRLRVENVGTPPQSPTDDSANLILGRNGLAPLVSLTPIGSTRSGEFSVAVVRPKPEGVPAVTGQNFIDLEVSLQPAAGGLREAVLTLYSNDAIEPVKEVRLSATATVSERCVVLPSPALVSFGDVPPNSSEGQTVTLRNTSSRVCVLAGVEIASGSSTGFSLPGPGSFMLGPMQELPLRVTFDSTGFSTGDSATGFLRYQTAGDTPRLVPLSARVARCLVAVPEEIDFGTIKLGCRSSGRTVQVFNTCGSNARLSSVSTSAPFSIVSQPAIGAAGLLIAPATAVPITVNFSPPGLGAHSGSLELRTAEGSSTRTLSVGLRGTGDMTGITVETYQQPVQPLGDVLFTIDDSCSMADKQQALGSNFGSFIAYATMANLDYHLAVTTTDDFARQGRFVMGNGPTVLTNTTPNLNDVFRQRVAVGVSGSGSERPLSTTLKALTAPLIGGVNAGFLRDEANLAIIIVSDAPDQSPEAISYYVSQLPLVKGVRRRHQVSVSVIGPFTQPGPTCTTEGLDRSGRYDAVIDATGGVKQTICKSNWASDLEQLGRSTLGPRNTFFVRNPPDTMQPVDVAVNGQTVSNAWNYDGASNAIVFAEGQAPGAGTTVTITYQSMCL